MFPLFNLGAQNNSIQVYISGPAYAEVGISALFTAEWVGTPDPGYVFDRFEWEADFLGTSGAVVGDVQGLLAYQLPYESYSNPSTASITWGEEYAPVLSTVKVTAVFVKQGEDPYQSSQTYAVSVRGICPPTLSGASSVQRCCPTARTYCVEGYCDGDVFNWTWPANWSLVGSDNGPCITLLPDNSGGGSVSCTIRRSESVYAYSKTVSKQISRPAPTLSLSSPFQKDTLCRKTEYLYRVQPLCGANLYTWHFPSGWNILNGQGTEEVVVEPSPTAISGEVSIVATFPDDNCGTAIAQAYLHLLDVPPAPVVFPDENSPPEYSNAYHCGEWWICSGNQWQENRIRFVEVDKYVEFMYWELVPTTPGGSTSWHFGSGTNVQSIVTGRQYFSPEIHGPQGAGPGKLRVKVVNYCGLESNWTAAIDFNEQTGFWCENSYPIWCECCNPDPNLPPMAVMEDDGKLIQEMRKAMVNESHRVLQVNPNPFSGTFEMSWSSDLEVKEIDVLDVNGKILFHLDRVASSPIILDLSGERSGLYFLRVYTHKGIETKRLLKLDAQ